MPGEVVLRVEVFGCPPPAVDGVPGEIRTDVYRVLPVEREHRADWAFCVRHTPTDDPKLHDTAEALMVGWALGRLGGSIDATVEWWKEGT